MAYFKEAEKFLAKLPSISLEGMEPLGSQGAKEYSVAMDSQGYKVGLAGWLLRPEGLPSHHWESAGMQDSYLAPLRRTLTLTFLTVPGFSLTTFMHGVCALNSCLQAPLASAP